MKTIKPTNLVLPISVGRPAAFMHRGTVVSGVVVKATKRMIYLNNGAGRKVTGYRRSLINVR